MSLVICRECGSQVSTKAASCPNCGAPPPTGSSLAAPVSRGAVYAVLGLAVVIGLLGIAAFMPDHGAPPSPAAAPPAPAPAAQALPPSHYYTWHRDGFYGYEFEQSEFAREHDEEPPAIRYLYEGRVNGVYHFKQFNGRFIDDFSCAAPCETVHIRNAQVDQDMSLRPMTPLWAAVQDILHGRLEPRR